MRIRQIKPEFYLDDQLAEHCSRDARLLFIGLWLIADRKGRLEERLPKIKAQVFPYDIDVTSKKINEMLSSLASGSFIIRYSRDNRDLIQIRSFEKHQHCHIKEPDSKLPAPDDHDAVPRKHGSGTVLKPGLPKSLEGQDLQEHRTRTVQERCENGSSPSASGLRLLDNGLQLLEPPIPPTQVSGSNGSFSTFWSAYPLKIGKGAAEKSWRRIHPTQELIHAIILAIESQRQSEQWTKNNGEFIPHPATWLNQRRWEDEIRTEVSLHDQLFGKR